MTRTLGLSFAVFLCVFHLAKGETTSCMNTEIIKSGSSVTFETSESTTQVFNWDGSKFLIIETPSNVVSQQESCAVILQNGQKAEVIMSFRILDQGSTRYCWKGILRDNVLFYVKGQPKTTTAGFTIPECLSQLGSTTSYKVMMKQPLPSNSGTVPNFGIDFSAVVKPGTYRLTYAFDDRAQECATSTMTESFIVVTSTSVTAKPCGTQTTPTYEKPFNKELFVAGYVEDSKLDVIRDGNQVGGAFVVLVYHEVGQKFRYYVMRVFEKVFMDMTRPNYLEMFGITSASQAYSPVGYVDRKYVPSATINNVLVLQSYSESCQSDPCKNGGTCVNQWLKYICTCPVGYAGAACEIKDDECSKSADKGSLCSNHGTCVPTANSYTCNCSDGFTGPQCKETTTCTSTTCKNGGTCYDPDINQLAICDCPTGYMGPTCEDTATCSTKKPCKNGGTCYDGNNGEYTCICPEGFTGINCDGSDTRQSAPRICIEGIDNVCQNGGKCVDGKCVCMAYYTGRYCEDLNDWFIGSVVLIVLLAVVMVITLIICCFFCVRGSTQSADKPEKYYDPFMSGGQDPARSSSGYEPDGFTANRYPDPAFYNDGYTSRF